ncbi:MAG: hypothetical protein ACLP9L_08755 [Thermoguttaceae bacterium]
MSVAAVCRRHDIATSMVFRSRIQSSFNEKERAKLAAVRLADGQTGASSTPLVLPAARRHDGGRLAGGRRSHLPAAIWKQSDSMSSIGRRRDDDRFGPREGAFGAGLERNST